MFWQRSRSSFVSKKLHDYEFKLFAPNNVEASLIADFTDWQAIPMRKGEDGFFRLTQRLKDGKYHYKFNVRSKSWFYEEDEWKSITDPYATDIDAETQNSILVISNGIKIVDEYVWTSDNVPLPSNDRLVIYEMHVSDFSGGERDPFTRGRYTDVIAKLDHLLALGINAIELMPVKSNPGDFNWGYSPMHYFAPESNFGTTAELKELIDKCHAVGIRVIVDGVYNHASTENALAQIDHDYWFRHEGKDPAQNWGPEFNYEYFDERFGKIPALDFILDSIRHWIYEYRIDGIRFDAAKQIDNFEALGKFVAVAREMAAMKPFFTVAEYIPPSPSVTEPSGPVESCWNDSFMHAVVDYLAGGPLYLEQIKDAIDPTRLGYAGCTNITNYLANHDQNRLFRKLGEKGILDDELYRRAKLGALVLMTAVGVPMIWMGEEFGEHVPISEQSNKIDWTLLEHDSNKDLFAYYRTLIHFRTSNQALHSNYVDFFFEDPERGVIGFTRTGADGSAVAVILNLSDGDLVDYSVGNFPFDGLCREITKGFTFEARENHLTINIPRREGQLIVPA